MTLQNNYGQLGDRPATAGLPLATPGAEDILSRAAGVVSPQISTITVDTAVDSTTYSYTFEGVVVSFESDASATLPEIADGLAAAHNAALLPDSKTLMTIAIAVSDGIDTVTITARDLSYAYSISETDANLTLVNTALSAGSLLAFGVGVDDSADFVSALEHSNGGAFAGVVKYFQRRELYSSESIAAEGGRVLDIFTQGIIWVLCDAGVEPQAGDDVFCRFSASGSEVRGAFRLDADTADADQIPASRAEWVGVSATDINGNNVAQLRLK